LNGQPLFQECREKHAAFHQFAAEVVRKCDTGDKTEAQVLLDSQYRVLTRNIIKSLTSVAHGPEGALGRLSCVLRETLERRVWRPHYWLVL